MSPAANESAPLVRLSHVAKRFESSETSDTEVLSDVDFAVGRGESIAIVGPSGSGKSTLLNIIGGLLPQTSGTVTFEGTELSTLDPDALAAFRNREIGFVFQSHHLLPQCTALENVLIPTLVLLDSIARETAVDRARTLLTDVGLGDRMTHRPGKLSGGECQRVAVVRALINRPKLVLADEPTGSLDARAAEVLGELLCGLNEKESVALVAVTHSEALAARMQRVFSLENGKLNEVDAQRHSRTTHG